MTNKSLEYVRKGKTHNVLFKFNTTHVQRQSTSK